MSQHLELRPIVVDIPKCCSWTNWIVVKTAKECNSLLAQYFERKVCLRMVPSRLRQLLNAKNTIILSDFKFIPFISSWVQKLFFSEPGSSLYFSRKTFKSKLDRAKTWNWSQTCFVYLISAPGPITLEIMKNGSAIKF